MPLPAAHDTIGLDLHKRETQLCVLAADGAVAERRIATTRAAFTAALGDRPPARVLLEASTESEWVARHLEGLGHEVVVADPGYAPMYATRSRRVKTDRRDARTLAEACRLGAYRPAHRLSEPQRHVRAELAVRDALVRDALVRTRTRFIAVLKALVRRDGLRLTAGDAERTAAKFAVLDATGVVTPVLRAEVAPLLTILAPLNEQVAAADRRLAAIAAEDARVRRPMTAPGIGPVTATAFVATLDDAGRFQDAHQVMAYLGLVPSEKSSGERQHRGRITKAGSPRVRWLLVEAAWRILRSRDAQAAPLQTWATRVALRRGKRVAVVALARRLAGVLYVMWRDGTDYCAARVRTREVLAA